MEGPLIELEGVVFWGATDFDSLSDEDVPTEEIPSANSTPWEASPTGADEDGASVVILSKEDDDAVAAMVIEGLDNDDATSEEALVVSGKENDCNGTDDFEEDDWLGWVVEGSDPS